MDYAIRRLDGSEVEEALNLCWKTFLEFEAPDYAPEGTDTFRRDIMESETFKEACRSGSNRMWGALDGNKIIGVIVMRGESHISLCFVDQAYHRVKIATSIFRLLAEDTAKENPEAARITVNSSPYAVPFYHQIGFADREPEKTTNGIRYTPMEYKMPDNLQRRG